MPLIATRHSFRRRIKIGFMALFLLGSSTFAFAAQKMCGGGGMWAGSSVWCHTYWYGYRECNIYDSDGSVAVSDVDPSSACAAMAS